MERKTQLESIRIYDVIISVLLNYMYDLRKLYISLIARTTRYVKLKTIHRKSFFFVSFNMLEVTRISKRFGMKDLIRNSGKQVLQCFHILTARASYLLGSILTGKALFLLFTHSMYFRAVLHARRGLLSPAIDYTNILTSKEQRKKRKMKIRKERKKDNSNKRKLVIKMGFIAI